MSHSMPNLVGLRCERMIVVAWEGPGSRWRVRCDCGTEKVLPGTHARRTKSCGCLSRDILLLRNHRHGEAGRKGRTAEYQTWQGIIKRCTDPGSDSWEYYGGRGISVCDRWRASFPAFLSDVGRRPSPQHSLDRYPNNDGNYEPGNVRWATRSEQMQNTRAAIRGRQSGPLCRALLAFRKLSQSDREAFFLTVQGDAFDSRITHPRPPKARQTENEERSGGAASARRTLRRPSC